MSISQVYFTFKPIFHCDAKPFGLGTFASPNAKDTDMLVSFALGDANFSQNSNASQWNIGCVGSQTPNFRVSHVFAFVSQRKPSYHQTVFSTLVALVENVFRWLWYELYGKTTVDKANFAVLVAVSLRADLHPHINNKI